MTVADFIAAHTGVDGKVPVDDTIWLESKGAIVILRRSDCALLVAPHRSLERALQELEAIPVSIAAHTEPVWEPTPSRRWPDGEGFGVGCLWEEEDVLVQPADVAEDIAEWFGLSWQECLAAANSWSATRRRPRSRRQQPAGILREGFRRDTLRLRLALAAETASARRANRRG